ncbi:MAG: hypothetical protein ACTSUQ_12600, partial [Candidatus Freyarchaeota archaeon]
PPGETTPRGNDPTRLHRAGPQHTRLARLAHPPHPTKPGGAEPPNEAAQTDTGAKTLRTQTKRQIIF